MNIVMKRPNSAAATDARRKFMGMLNRTPFGEILDLDFDNDNDEPLTAEHLDWCQARKPAHLT